jgi:hypothetical protein
MRFHEFYRFEEGRVTEVQTLWDIPEVMMQANAWPMAPSLGLEFCIPGRRRMTASCRALGRGARRGESGATSSTCSTT